MVGHGHGGDTTMSNAGYLILSAGVLLLGVGTTKVVHSGHREAATPEKALRKVDSRFGRR